MKTILRLKDRLQASLPGRLAAKFVADGGPTWAVVIAWNLLFALLPTVLAMVTILGFAVNLAGSPENRLQDIAYSVIPDDAGRRTLIESVPTHRATGLVGALALVGLVWSGSALFGAMEESFARIYGGRQRPFLKQKLMAVGMILIFTVLLGVSIVTLAGLSFLESLATLPWFLTSRPAALAFQVVVGLLSGWVLFGTVYVVVPPIKRSFRQIWPGALVAGILFEGLALVFPIYVALTHAGALGGRALGLFLVLLTYLYFLGMITVLGAELNSLYEAKGGLWQHRPD